MFYILIYLNVEKIFLIKCFIIPIQVNHWNPKEVEPFLLLREENRTYIRSKKERKKFVQFLADGLPKRTLYSVYHRFRTLYADNFQRR